MFDFAPKYRLLLVTAVLGLALSGCRDDVDTGFGTCTNSFNAAIPVTQPAAFTLDGDTPDPATFSFNDTVMLQIFRSLQPLNGSTEDQALADRIETLASRFVTFEGSYPDYISTRNEFDVVEYLLATGSIGTFSDGMQAIESCIQQSRAVLYSNPDVVLEATDADEGETDLWAMQLNMTHQPRNQQVSRVLFNRGDTRFFQMSTQYNSETFRADQFNTPRQVLLAMDEKDGDYGDAVPPRLTMDLNLTQPRFSLRWRDPQGLGEPFHPDGDTTEDIYCLRVDTLPGEDPDVYKARYYWNTAASGAEQNPNPDNFCGLSRDEPTVEYQTKHRPEWSLSTGG